MRAGLRNFFIGIIADVVQSFRKSRNSNGRIDRKMIVAMIMLAVFGLLMVYSASSFPLQVDGKNVWLTTLRQLLFFIIGGFACAVMAILLDYHLFLKWTPYLYLFCVFLNLYTMFFGVSSHGQKRWLRIAGIRFQPSEVSKIVCIFALSILLVKLSSKKSAGIGKVFFDLLIVGMWSLALAGPIAVRNLSTGLIIIFMSLLMYFLTQNIKTGAMIFWVGFLTLLIAGGLYTLYVFGDHLGFLGYRISRILVWRHPENYKDSGGYQVLRGLYAVGSGGLLGRGFGRGLQKVTGLPESDNDMIFAVICEELGVVGVAILFIIYAYLFYRMAMAIAKVKDIYGRFIIIGVMAHFSCQIVLNVCVVTGLIPNTGVTLPFISYGGTAIITSMIEVGLVLNVMHCDRKKKSSGAER
jgi:hypothetical protein